MQFLCADHDSTSEPFLELKCLMLNLSQEFKKKKKSESMWCAGFVPEKFVFRFLSVTSELSETVRWKLEYGHMDLTECVPFWLQKRCRAYALLLQYDYTASYATVGTRWGVLSCFAFFFFVVF